MKKFIFSVLFASFLVPLSGQALSPIVACVPGDLFNRYTGERCSVTGTIPGCLTGYKFSYLTGQKCSVDIKPIDYCAYAHLVIGSEGAQVIELQAKLIADGYLVMPYGVAKGYYGNLTAQGVARAKAAGLYPCHVVGNQPPVISGVSGPTVLKVGEQGSWMVKASDPENGQLWYFVDWGDVQMIDYGGIGASGIPSDFKQVTTFTHSYSQAGTYTVKFLVRDTSGNESKSTLTVKVGGTVANQATIKVVSPNGGESWLDHSVQNIKWENVYTACLNISPCPALPSSDFYNRKVDINLFSQSANLDCRQAGGEICPQDISAFYNLDRNVTRTNNSYGWIVATDINDRQIPAGKYKVQVCVAGSTTDCDFSDSYFEIFWPQAH